MNDPQPDFSQPETQPALPPPVPGPWGFWPTLGFGLIGIAAMIGVPALSLVVGGVLRAIQSQRVALNQLAHLGDFAAVSTLATTPVVLGLCLLFASLRRPFPIREYLGITMPKVKDVMAGLVALAIFSAVALGTEKLADQPFNAEMVQMYRSAQHPSLLFLAVMVAAPITEELLFRGFMMPGLYGSKAGWFGSALVASCLWTALHVQYRGLEIAEVFVLGIILGWLRHRNRSLWVPILIHALNNLIATAFLMSYLRSQHGE